MRPAIVGRVHNNSLRVNGPDGGLREADLLLGRNVAMRPDKQRAHPAVTCPPLGRSSW